MDLASLDLAACIRECRRVSHDLDQANDADEFHLVAVLEPELDALLERLTELQAGRDGC